jgi:hypothetical protein
LLRDLQLMPGDIHTGLAENLEARARLRVGHASPRRRERGWRA